MRSYKTKKCEYCEQEKVIAAKGLCRACYQRQQTTGSLEYQRKGIGHLKNSIELMKCAIKYLSK